MSRSKKYWIGIALFNLAIVALLGFILRSKILFSMPFIEYKHLLHAHSHFAFGGWVTLAIMALMTYEILPGSSGSKTVYKWLLGGVATCAVAMMVSFLLQGYGFFSILFSTLFIFITYAYSYRFLKDLYRTKNTRVIKLLATTSLVYLTLSSIGPFTLAYILATKSANVLLYKDAIYTYLHLQYNGFFTLAIMALLFNRIEHLLAKRSEKKIYHFAHVLNLTVIPSMFLSYLWHYPNAIFLTMAILGCLILLLCTVNFFIVFKNVWVVIRKDKQIVRIIGITSMIAFVIKMVMQSLTIIPSIGELVFANRPMIIGFLHLVLLCFVTLYLLTHLMYAGYLRLQKQTVIAVYVFASAVVLNEVVLVMQGLGVMFMTNSAIYAKLLWLTGGGLFIGAALMTRSYLAKYESRLFQVQIKKITS